MNRSLHPPLPLRTIALLMLLGAAPLQGQDSMPWISGPEERPRRMGDATYLSLNALSGGLSGGLLQRLRGGSFADGFTRGAVGGGVHYGGMRISAQRFAGAGLLGRQVSAVGASITRNASEERPLLETIFLPVGPLNLYVRPSRAPQARVKVNLTGLAVLSVGLLHPEYHFDPGSSLSSGAPVFRLADRKASFGDRQVEGFVIGGTIMLSAMEYEEKAARVLAHERIHVLQGDWLLHVWSDPVESWALDRVPRGAAIQRHLNIDIVAIGAREAVYGALRVEQKKRLYEREAYFLADR